jgi:arylsulfatase A-like enzyme
VWILLDDVGYGASGTFGGLIHTPTFDTLAGNGLRYTNFHTTAEILRDKGYNPFAVGKYGVTPADPVLPDRNPDIEAWDKLTPEEQKRYTRFLEVCAGYLTPLNQNWAAFLP